MNNINAYPLNWPPGWQRSVKQIKSRFGRGDNKPSIYEATKFLNQELKRFLATDIIISSNLELRNDGLPRSNQKTPDDAGIAVYFTHKKKQRVLACDTYNLPGCNIYAIAKTIESLRAINRHGVSQIIDKAFDGFKALPQNAGQSNLAWYLVLEVKETANIAEVNEAYRKLAKIHHPDAGGSADKFNLLQEALKQAKEFLGVV